MERRSWHRRRGDGTSDGYCREQDTCVVPRRDMREESRTEPLDDAVLGPATS